MRRRELIALLAGVGAAWPLGVAAQPSRQPTIGFLGSGSPHFFLAAAEFCWIGEIRRIGEVVSKEQTPENFLIDLVADVRLAFQCVICGPSQVVSRVSAG